MKTIVKRNYEYYQKNVLNNYYIFTTNKNDSIVVKPTPESLAHLLGVKYATQNGLFRYSGTKFYNEMSMYENGNPPLISIYDFIDEKRDMNKTLSQEEKWCKNKNEIFIELFENLNQGIQNIKIYRNNHRGDFNANYLQIKVLNKDNKTFGYIGIYGDNTDDYFKFNSILSDYGEKNKSSNHVNIKKFEIIPAKLFIETNYKFMPSPQNKKKSKRNTQSKRRTFDLNRKNVNKINQQILPFQIQKGNLNKKNWQLKNDKQIVEKEFEKLNKWNSVEEIIKYIEDKYKKTGA